MALAKVVSEADVSLKLSRPQLTSLANYGLTTRSRRATDVTGTTDHGSEHDARRHSILSGDCL